MAEASSIRVRVEIVEDYRSGRELRARILPRGGKRNEESVDEIHEFIIDVPITEGSVDVYILGCGIGERTLHKLKSFPTTAAAEHYCKQQYYYATGDYPFVATGMTSACASTGSRPEIDMTGSSNDIAEDLFSDEFTFFICIASKECFVGNSLGPFDEWTPTSASPSWVVRSTSPMRK